jgi:NAD(P)-dependent dehydrogenase (short-subunit alcohol dehydrogenase family)
MDLELHGKSVLITGASRGIGLACAEGFLAEGASVTLVSRPSPTLDAEAARLSGQYPGAVEALAADLSTAAGVARIDRNLQTADIVVNNAGAIPGGGLDTVDDEAWRSAWDLKVFGYVGVCRRCLPAMRERGSGVVVNIIGYAGAAPRYDYISGSMANSALMAFTRAAGGASPAWGVRIVGINPGATATDRLVTVSKGRAREAHGDEDRWEEMLTHLPFGRAGLPREMADLALFVASARASYLSGVVIDADAGVMWTNS